MRTLLSLTLVLGATHAMAQHSTLPGPECEADITPAERIEIERACERLAIAYTHYTDFGQGARVADLFTEDGVWESGTAKYDGQDAIRKAFTARRNRKERVSRHVCTNFGLRIIDKDHAEGIIYLTLYRQDDEPEKLPRELNGLPELVGEYHDTFVRTADGWRFSYRKILTAFYRGVDDEGNEGEAGAEKAQD